MSKDSRSANGAESKKDLLLFDPDKLVIVEDEGSALRDDRAKFPPDESMVLSIMARGVIQSITVRKNPETDKTEVVDGRQRVIATREANRRLKKEGRDPVLVPAIVKRTSALDSLAMMITANEQRSDDTVGNRAKKLARLLDLGGTEEDAAIAFGVTKATIKNMVAYLDAPACVRKAAEAGHVTASQAYQLAKLEPDEAKKKLEELKSAAPREPGKKRSKNAKKAREIVSGSAALRGKKEIAAKLEEIQQSEAINENKRMGAEAAMKWVLGDDEALGAIL
jgi:ParB family transcriptional regulator, chromosome partitioning protein